MSWVSWPPNQRRSYSFGTLAASSQRKLPGNILLSSGWWTLRTECWIWMKCYLFIYRLPLYQALFTSFRQCLIERQVPVLLPGVMMKGQAQVQVTLYQHVCVRLCASVAALPPVCFSVLVSSTHFQSSFFKLYLNELFLFISILTCRLKSPTGFRDLFPVFLLSHQWQEPCEVIRLVIGCIIKDKD